eukprot:1186849-Pyramimonas_sp.AAC.1
MALVRPRLSSAIDLPARWPRPSRRPRRKAGMSRRALARIPVPPPSAPPAGSQTGEACRAAAADRLLCAARG